jgi:formate dehydrogenase (coenzyme F420) beta subunit
MNVNRILHVRDEDTLKTVQGFLAEWWGQVGLDAMLAPVELPDHSAVSPQIIADPAELANVNPFAPVMLANTATMIQDFVRDHPNRHLAVILRPCELRAMIELRKRHRVYYQSVYGGNDAESLIVIGVDCPGTFSQDEYHQHLISSQNGGEMLHVGLSYGKKESYIPHEVRATCQMCDSPAPLGADLVVGTIGIEPQGDLLLIARNEDVDASLQLQNVTDRFAAEQQVVCREVMVGKLVDKRTEIRSALMNQALPEDFTSALALFARCTLCADCLDACPLYDGELAGMLGAGEGRQSGRALLSELIRVSRWLASCSGCGMCRESCEYGIPLTQIVTTLSHRIQSELHYKPGDPSQRLPWLV